MVAAFQREVDLVAIVFVSKHGVLIVLIWMHLVDPATSGVVKNYNGYKNHINNRRGKRHGL